MLNLHTTDHPECVHGFISVAAFEHVMAATEVFSPNGKRISIFGLRFNCSSAIKKWIVGAQITEQHNLSQIFVGNMAVKARHNYSLNPLNTTLYLNVYEYEPHKQVFSHKGDYISIISSQIYYQRCALGDCTARPLVAVDTSEFRVVLHHVIN